MITILIMVDDHHPDDDQPEEGVGVQVACAHHDHVHLCCASIFERRNLQIVIVIHYFLNS